METKICRICGSEKELTLFEIDSRKKTKYTNRCKMCKYDLDDKAQRAYRSLKRRAIKFNIPVEVTPKEIRLLFDVFQGCAYCGKKPDHESKLHLEHIVPLSDGGRNTLANLLPACASCNASKSNKPIISHFMSHRDNFPDENLALVIDYMSLLSGMKKEDVVKGMTNDHIKFEVKMQLQELEKELPS